MNENFRYELVASDPDTGARAEVLHTPHGTIETPVFMPVSTATVKLSTSTTLKKLMPRLCSLTPTTYTCGPATSWSTAWAVYTLL